MMSVYILPYARCCERMGIYGFWFVVVCTQCMAHEAAAWVSTLSSCRRGAGMPAVDWTARGGGVTVKFVVVGRVAGMIFVSIFPYSSLANGGAVVRCVVP